MKALILDGSRADDEAARMARASVEERLKRAGWTVEAVVLRDKKIAWCTGCFGCWIKTPGTCVIDDEGRQIARSLIRSDLAVLVTPVTFGGYSAELKKVLDRTIPLIMPYFTMVKGEVHHVKRYPRYPSFLGLGTLPSHDEEAERIFRALVARNALNFYCPSHAAGIILQGQAGEAVDREVAAMLGRVGATA
jgi:hypothetical protein